MGATGTSNEDNKKAEERRAKLATLHRFKQSFLYTGKAKDKQRRDLKRENWRFSKPTTSKDIKQFSHSLFLYSVNIEGPLCDLFDTEGQLRLSVD